MFGPLCIDGHSNRTKKTLYIDISDEVYDKCV